MLIFLNWERNYYLLPITLLDRRWAASPHVRQQPKQRGYDQFSQEKLLNASAYVGLSDLKLCLSSLFHGPISKETPWTCTGSGCRRSRCKARPGRSHENRYPQIKVCWALRCKWLIKRQRLLFLPLYWFMLKIPHTCRFIVKQHIAQPKIGWKSMFPQSVCIIIFITNFSNLTNSLISQVHCVFGNVYLGFWFPVPSNNLLVCFGISLLVSWSCL